LSINAKDVTLAWDDSDAAGFKIHYGLGSRNYSQSIDVGKLTQYTVTGLTDANYYFSATAYDSNGNESGFSFEVNSNGIIAPLPEPACCGKIIKEIK
jgi:hypothetical protein